MLLNRGNVNFMHYSDFFVFEGYCGVARDGLTLELGVLASFWRRFENGDGGKGVPKKKARYAR